jgi:hypothetical protein
MVERKHAKLIITEPIMLEPPAGFENELLEEKKKQDKEKKKGNWINYDTLFGVGGKVSKTSLFTVCNVVKDRHGTGVGVDTKAHSHDWDESFIFIGTNKDNLRDLGGEIELWIEDEQYCITESCTIFIPKGMIHCPCLFRRVNSPIIWILIGHANAYSANLDKSGRHYDYVTKKVKVG